MEWEYGKVVATAINNQHGDKIKCCETPEGVLYGDDYITVDGVAIILIQTSKLTKEDMKKASRWIRSERDVVSHEIIHASKITYLKGRKK